MAWDRYTYASNNPVKYTDPTGHSVDCGVSDDNCEAGKIQNPKDLIFRKNEALAALVAAGEISDLEAFALLADYAASLTPDCVECFLDNLSAVVSGISNVNNSAKYEFMHRIDPENYPYDEYFLEASKFKQTGYAVEFQDPDPRRTGANQARHFMFYIQVGYEVGEVLGGAVNLGHECCIPLHTTAGKSYEDYALGAVGLNLGAQLKAGAVNLNDVGNYIRTTLAPGSSEAQKWYKLPEPWYYYNP
ncbi:MAG: hypothetical protein Fur0022_09160 [Anaerolineales bacterium]